MVTPGSQQDFVVLTAQIIPVLILALVADPVARKKKRGNSSIMLLVALTAGVIGEAVALVSIYVGGEDWGIQVIGICLTVLAFAILRPHALVYWTLLVARYRLSSTRQALAQVLLFPYLGYMTWYNAVNDTQYHARAWSSAASLRSSWSASLSSGEGAERKSCAPKRRLPLKSDRMRVKRPSLR